MSGNQRIVPVLSSDPPAVAGAIVEYAKTVGGIAQPFVRKSDGTVQQMGFPGRPPIAAGAYISSSLFGFGVTSFNFVGGVYQINLEVPPTSPYDYAILVTPVGTNQGPNGWVARNVNGSGIEIKFFGSITGGTPGSFDSSGVPVTADFMFACIPLL